MKKNTLGRYIFYKKKCVLKKVLEIRETKFDRYTYNLYEPLIIIPMIRLK